MAIDRLAFVTSRPPDAFLVVLTVAAMGGMLGVQLRSIVNFIGIACIKNVLDVPRWWPWYWLRPVLGVLLGILLVVLIKTRLFTSPLEQAADDSLWWLGMTILVGFGSSEFTERLRLLTQTLFGKS